MRALPLLALLFIPPSALGEVKTARDIDSTELTDPGSSGQIAAPLTRARDVRSLRPRQAAARPPLRLRGVVTFCWLETFVLQDESAAVWVHRLPAQESAQPSPSLAALDQVKTGDLVEVEGLVDPGDYAPNVFATSWRRLGTAPLPPSQPLTSDDFRSGAHLSQRRHAQGKVIAVTPGSDYWTLKLQSDLGAFFVAVVSHRSLSKQSFLGAEVAVDGIAGALFNGRGEFFALRLRTNHEGLRVLSGAENDLFGLPKAPLGELAPFSLEPLALQRRLVEGTVTYCDRDKLYLQEGLIAIRVRPVSPQIFPVGTRVEASGFLDYSRPVAGLTAATVRAVGTATIPTPVELSVPILRAAYATVEKGGRAYPCDYDGKLVRVEGRLSSLHTGDSSFACRLMLSTPHGSISALLRDDDSRTAKSRLRGLHIGSQLQLTGIANLLYVKTEREGESWRSPSPYGISVLLRSVEDVTVLKAASGWNPATLMLALGIAVLLALIALVWVLELRRTVRKQTLRIEESLRAHRDAELEQQAARDERFRLASDLHDSLQQHLTGAGYRIEAGLVRLGSAPEEVREQFLAARAALERTRSGLRDCLVGLREEEAGPNDFTTLIRRTLEKADHWPQDSLRIGQEGTAFPLSHRVAGSLLLFAQEAVANAFKHAAPSQVNVSVRFREDAFELEVQDDGRGFEEISTRTGLSVHLGLESLRNRLRWLGGEACIASQPGQGTRAIARLSREAAQRRA